MYLMSASETAECIIDFCNKHGDPITNLRLQKLLYYTQAWYLALFGTPLFKEHFEAWVHGPAVPSVYGEYKKFGFQPIDLKPTCEAPDSVHSHIAEVMKVYGSFSAYDLERMTHEEDPWITARNGLAPDKPSKNKIKNDDMLRFYKAKLKNGKA